MKSIKRTLYLLLLSCLVAAVAGCKQNDSAKKTDELAQKIIAKNSQTLQSETLDKRQESIIPIAAFTATGDSIKLEKALHKGLDQGLSINEIKEILIHSYAYAGFPRALNGITTFEQVVENRKKQGIVDKAGKEASSLPSGFNATLFGHRVRNFLVGRDISNRKSGYPVFTPVIDRFLVDHLFAGIFFRDVLSFQDRELVTISILSALPKTDPQLRGHLAIAMRMGLTANQLKQFVALLQTRVSATSAMRAETLLDEVLGQAKKETSKKSLTITKKKAPRKAPTEHFSGSARVESLFASEVDNSYRGGIVHFEKGARTAWHTHPLGQTLIVISGKGRVQAEGEDIKLIAPGDVVWIPANTKHWHGAAEDSKMSHVAISDHFDGKTVEWMELVK